MLRNTLCRDLTGRFVGCDGRPDRATCSFHDEPCCLRAGDVIQLEVERVDGVWSPLFHRCERHAVAVFPREHSLYGTPQVLVSTRLDPTGAHLPGTNEYVPDALTVGTIDIVDVSPADEGLRPRC